MNKRKRGIAGFSNLLLASPLAGVLVAGPAAAQTVQANTLRAGAARLELADLALADPAQFTGVNDPVYVRAVVIENAGVRAAIVSLDVGAVGTATWEAVSRRLGQEAGIAPNALLLTATHTHSMPRLAGPALERRIVETVNAAAAKLARVSMTWGTGESHINTNRNMIDPATRRWTEGPNRAGPSDKTVAVFSFRRQDGSTVAIVYNYAVHAVVTGQLDELSGDIPGAASRHVEEYLGGGAVALWNSGAAGDQNPLYFQQTYDLRQIRIDDHAARGKDISKAMLPGGVGLDRSDPQVARLMDQQRALSNAMGLMLGEEVLHTLRANMEAPVVEAPISAVSQTVMCPGRRRLDQGRAGLPGVYEPGDNLPIRLSLLRIGDVVIGGVDAEVYSGIAARFFDLSPYKHTIMSTLTNGMASTGYIPTDAAFGQYTFEVLSSRLQPGCAETAIVSGLIDLIAETGPNAGPAMRAGDGE